MAEPRGRGGVRRTDGASLAHGVGLGTGLRRRRRQDRERRSGPLSYAHRCRPLAQGGAAAHPCRDRGSVGEARRRTPPQDLGPGVAHRPHQRHHPEVAVGRSRDRVQELAQRQLDQEVALELNGRRGRQLGRGGLGCEKRRGVRLLRRDRVHSLCQLADNPLGKRDVHRRHRVRCQAPAGRLDRGSLVNRQLHHLRPEGHRVGPLQAHPDAPEPAADLEFVPLRGPADETDEQHVEVEPEAPRRAEHLGGVANRLLARRQFRGPSRAGREGRPRR